MPAVEPNGSAIFTNDTTWVHGNHSIRWGAEVRKYFYDEDFRGNTTGTFTFGAWQTADPQNDGTTGYSFASFMLGDVAKSSQTIDKANPKSRVWNPAFYVADDWKVTRRLTLNIGLRWDIVGGVTETTLALPDWAPRRRIPDAGGYPGSAGFPERYASQVVPEYVTMASWPALSGLPTRSTTNSCCAAATA